MDVRAGPLPVRQPHVNVSRETAEAGPRSEISGMVFVSSVNHSPSIERQPLFQAQWLHPWSIYRRRRKNIAGALMFKFV